MPVNWSEWRRQLGKSLCSNTTLSLLYTLTTWLSLSPLYHTSSLQLLKLYRLQLQFYFKPFALLSTISCLNYLFTTLFLSHYSSSFCSILNYSPLSHSLTLFSGSTLISVTILLTDHVCLTYLWVNPLILDLGLVVLVLPSVFIYFSFLTF